MTHNGAGSSKSIPIQVCPPGPPRISCINTYLNNHSLRLGRVLGEGSYSKVRLCTHKNPNNGTERRIACKIIDKQKASGDFVNKFLPRELEIVSRLKNPNIISVYDVVDFNDHVFIFMDFCNRGDLLEYIKHRGFLSERRSKNYFHQLLSAVRYLHGLDLAHRDLKCENILLCHGDVVKISDFGFSRYCHDAQGKRILSNTYCGSAAYAAPEILQGTMYNPKLYDMWSLGCILFIMLTGHMPFDETNIPGMLDNQLKKILPYPQHVENLIGDTAKQLIRHLLEPDVTRRATIDQATSHSWFAQTEESLNSGGGDYQNRGCEPLVFRAEQPLGPIEVSGQANKIEVVGISIPPCDPPSASGSQRPTSRGNCGRQNATMTNTTTRASRTHLNPAAAIYRPGTPYPASGTTPTQNNQGEIPRTGPDRCATRRHAEESIEELTQQVQVLKIPRSANRKTCPTFKRK